MWLGRHVGLIALTWVPEGRTDEKTVHVNVEPGR